MLDRTVVRPSPVNDKPLNSDLHPVLRRIIALRPCQYTDYVLNDLLRPDTLSGLSGVVGRLMRARDEQSSICVIGDYDCDGATATAVAVRGLKLMGFHQVDYLIPNRFESGYGLSVSIVQQALALSSQPAILLTVDNGISSVDGVAYAKKHALDVIVTDHHLPGKILPDTPYIVNPQLENDKFQSKAICGVGVIFYVLLALRRALIQAKLLTEKIQMIPLLDLVTLGTVADCVPLDQNNRILIHHGLSRMRRDLVSPGIRALCRVGKVVQSQMSSVDLAFRVAPKLNAAGRMDDMSIGVRCLLSNDDAEATRLADQLAGFNSERTRVQDTMLQQALQQVDAKSLRVQQVIILYHKDWHQGVIGILASKIKERFHKPCIIFADDNDVDIKGSARSISGIHMRDLLDHVASSTSLIDKFGGHSMAAGLSIKRDNLSLFTNAINTCVTTVPASFFVPTITTDGPLGAHEISIGTADAIQSYGIWGHSYPEPIFDNVMIVLQKRVLKDKHLKLILKYQSVTYEAMWFFCSDQIMSMLQLNARYRFFYKLSINSYLGERKLNMLVEYAVMATECEVVEV